MTELEYEVVDVFTDTAFTGNPLAVVLGADELSTSQLQRIANEFNLSETAFPVAATDGADYRLRIFTPAVELPFAGHPSIGAAEVLRRRGAVSGPHVRQSCGAGLVTLDLSGEAVALSARPHGVSDPLDPAPLLAACGLGPDDLGDSRPRTASCGLAFTYLPVTPDALARVRPDVAALQRLDLGKGQPFGGLAVVAPGDGHLRARVFAYEAGVAEDPATGSAALGMGVWLDANGHLAGSPAYTVVQGVEMGRPSVLSCRVLRERGMLDLVEVSGRVVPVARGWIRVPAAD